MKVRHLALSGLVMVLAGCTATSASTGSSSFPSPGGTTTVVPPLCCPRRFDSGLTGLLTYVGGPIGTGHLPEPGRLMAKKMSGGFYKAEAIFSSGFKLRLPPGTYALTAKSGDARCFRQTVTVICARVHTGTRVL
jgi:hypothetical protein